MYRLSVATTALILCAGCFTYRAEPTPLPGAARVRVRFDPARSVDVAVAGRDTVRLSEVTELEGRVVEVRGDTLNLALDGGRARGGPVSGLVVGNSTAVVPLGAGRAVEVRRLDKGRTALVVVAGASIGLLALLLAAILSFADPDY